MQYNDFLGANFLRYMSTILAETAILINSQLQILCHHLPKIILVIHSPHTILILCLKKTRVHKKAYTIIKTIIL